MEIKEITCNLADVCLSDYWGGHHKAHICVPVCERTTLEELKSALRDELIQSAVAGSDRLAQLLTEPYDSPEHTAAYEKALAAIDAIQPTKKDAVLFPGIEAYDDEDDCDLPSVYAYFVFIVEEE